MSTKNLVDEIEQLLTELYPIRRSITGDGTRRTLEILGKIAPMKLHEVPSGTKVFDWTVPQEWKANRAWIEDAEGNRFADYEVHPLHLVNYSVAIDQRIEWANLKTHLFVHPNLEDAIPYRTSYYDATWGFCVTQNQWEELSIAKGPFRVFIDSQHFDGSLTYGEILLPGLHQREFLISTYICHPQMANDGLSGMILTALLARKLQNLSDRRWSYRIVFVPETIGAITYCHENPDRVKELYAGLEVTTVGGPGSFGLKQSWDERHWINDLLSDVMARNLGTFETHPFDIHGADERQFSSQAFRVNVATISKDRYYKYPEYHSSLDNLTLVTADQIRQSLELFETTLEELEALRFFRNKEPNCEVMLSKHGLYPKIGGAILPETGVRSDLSVAMWLLFYLDGKTPINSIARATGISNEKLKSTLTGLITSGLVEEV